MGYLFAIFAASGTGKTSLVHKLVSEDVNTVTVISCTTRQARPGEDSSSYQFVSPKVFEEMVQSDKFVEYQEVFGNYYGTPIDDLKDNLAKGKNVILEIDWQGALAVKEKFPEAVCITILPPSLAVLAQRIESRGSETPESLQIRLGQAKLDISKGIEIADFMVINDDFEQAYDDLLALIRTAPCNRHNFMKENQKLLAGFNESD